MVVSDECRFECRYECVCALEQVLEIEFCVASAFDVVVVAVAGVVCSASRVACLLLVHFSSLSSGFSEKVQGIL